MATIQEITSGSNYTGSAQLGGALGVGVTLDTSPLQRLATFAYYRGKGLWEKQNADDKLAAQQIASISAYDINSPLKPYSDDLKKELGDIQEFVRNNPDALVYSRSPEKFQELNERMNRFNNKRKGATVNDTLYNAAKAKIELIPNKQDRDAQMELLKLNVDGLFEGGLDNAYQQQMQLSPQLKPQDYVIPDIPLTEDYTITRNPNDIETTGLKYIDVSRLKPLADAVYFGLAKTLDETTPEFKALPESEKKRARIEASITDRTRANLDKVAASVNGLIQQVKASNPDLKVMDIPNEMLAQDSSIAGVISLSKEYNETMDKINSRTGNKYAHINLDDGATPTELIQLQTFYKNKEAFLSEIKPTVQQTDNAIQGRSQTEQERHNRALEAIGWKNAEDDGSVEAPVNLLQGNALNDIEIPTNTKPGIYTMGGKGGGNKKNIANIQRLLLVPDEEGKKKPLITKERLESNKESDKIEYEVVEFDGKPYVGRVKVDNVWYDRGFFRNSQLTADTEPLKGQRTAYRDSQNYGEGSLKSKDATKGSGSYLIKGKNYTESELIGMGYTVDQIKPYKK